MGSDYSACRSPSKKQGEDKENPPFSLPLFHEIKIRQNAYCILGKSERTPCSFPQDRGKQGQSEPVGT